jgi:pSer/pThr/pTyr-binding forkhead associated (FHA) protein
LFKLQINAGPAAGTTFELVGTMTIGREGADIAVEGDTEMSRRHARLRVDGQRVLVEDLGSTNGTFLDRAKVVQPTPVATGTPIRIGKTVLELRR